MLDSEIAAFLTLCRKKAHTGNPIAIVEWGSGYSTKYFTHQLEKEGIPYTWTSVEHDPDWANNVRKMIAGNPHITLLEVPLGDAYVHAPQGSFDIALVDGRMRVACVAYAKTIAETVLLHDAQRKSYPVTGTYIAPRLKVVGPTQPLSYIHPLLWKLRIFIWKNTKYRLMHLFR